VNDAKMPLVFAGRDFTDLAERVRRTAEITVEIVPETELRTWSSHAGSADPGVALTDSATALLAYTSGTTAAPKRVPIRMGPWGSGSAPPRRSRQWTGTLTTSA
jgi:acyl-coenzyme A synthetase/AMP-(fatty) acid ligase